MIEVSEETRSLINADSRTFGVKLVVGDNTYKQILSFKKTVIFPSSAMSIGNALSACIECSVADIPASITGAKIEVYMTILGSDEEIKLGEFTADKPTVQNGVVSLTAYDKMTEAANKTYIATLAEGEHTVQEYFVDICTVLNAECVELPEGLGQLLLSEDKLSGYSCRDALAYLAGFIGRNCIVNRDGRFEMLAFTAVDYSMLNSSRIDEPELSDSDCVIGYIACCVDSETTLQVGTGSNGFEFISPLMTQERLNDIADEIFGENSEVKVYKPGKITQLLGDPTLEICDVVNLDYNGNVYVYPIMSLVLDYDGGLQSEIESFELSELTSLSLSERLSFVHKQAKEQTNAYIKAVVDFSEAMQKAYGVSHTEIDGITYFHDSEDISEAEYIFCLTSKGLAFTSGANCWGGSHKDTVWQYGVNSDGEAVLKMLKVFHITADLITAGKLQSNDGNTYFDLDSGELISKKTRTDNDKIIEELFKITSGNVEINGKFGKVEFSNRISPFRINLNCGDKSDIKTLYDDFCDYHPENWANMTLTEQLAYALARSVEYYAKYSPGIVLDGTDGDKTYQNWLRPESMSFAAGTDSDSQTTEYSATGIKSDKPFYINNLRNFKRVLTSDDDLNEIIEEGVYPYSTASIPANCPYSNAGVVEVVHADSDTTRIIQRVTRYGVAGAMAFRTLYESNWNEWTKVAVTDSSLTFQKVTTADTNLDNYKTIGVYYFTSSYTPLNIPVGTNGWLFVLPNGDGGLKQIWFRAGTADSNDYHTFIRTYMDGSWSSWRTIAVVLTKTVTGTTNGNGNIVLNIGDDYALLSAKCSSACIATPYYSDSSGGSWRAHITSAVDNSNIANTEVTVTCRYVYAPTWLT